MKAQVVDGKMRNSFQNNSQMDGYLGKQRDLAKKCICRKCNHMWTLE